MRRLVECVPNFSEGRDQAIIDAIADVIRRTLGVSLLNVEPEGDYNRTVYTFVGDPKAIVEAAVAATAVAAKLIDMATQTGGHPRIGAADVVPFIPISGLAMEDCIECAKQYGKRVGDMGIPVYLYEQAATKMYRMNLADVRKGQYEGLEEKLQDPDWEPDFGPTEFNAKSGATITGARNFLIAYNIDLNANDVAAANEIAYRIRESGRPKKDADGNIIISANGKPERIPGSLKCLKALGVAMPEYDIAQVSMNLTDFRVTPMHVVFEEVKKEAADLGLSVTGSEVVGLVPKAAMLMAGRFYAERAGEAIEDEMALIEKAVEELGLSDLHPFDPTQKVIELKIASL